MSLESQASMWKEMFDIIERLKCLSSQTEKMSVRKPLLLERKEKGKHLKRELKKIKLEMVKLAEE
ncbi:conserved hypothetical protein [Ricinus communis]|uniref:Uncharacterized protein n=1 Tax=Ricinus communis TaxID=3988 RepID=B9RL29_RICCO|nr:conserved hypothetical protein [Ricinus communis]